jgi:hypothetical protein
MAALPSTEHSAGPPAGPLSSSALTLRGCVVHSVRARVDRDRIGLRCAWLEPPQRRPRDSKRRDASMEPATRARWPRRRSVPIRSPRTCTTVSKSKPLTPLLDFGNSVAETSGADHQGFQSTSTTNGIQRARPCATPEVCHVLPPRARRFMRCDLCQRSREHREVIRKIRVGNANAKRSRSGCTR